MSQHFLLTAAARTVSLKQVLRMGEAEAWTLFRAIRWPDTDGAPVCPHCDCPACWSCPRPGGAPRFRCSACRRDFSPTSGTLEFIPIKPLAATGSGGPGSYAGHSRFPSRHHGRPASTGGSGL